MAFKRMLPRKGTVIPEGHRPHGSTNALLHELPAFREHTVDLIGVPLFLPRQQMVVLPFRHHQGSMDVVVMEGDKTYPRGGYHLDVSDWELQRAEKLIYETSARRANDYWNTRRCASGIFVRTLVEDAVVIEPDPVCVKCGAWLNRPDYEIEFIVGLGGPECKGQVFCAERQYRRDRRDGVYRAPVQS